MLDHPLTYRVSVCPACNHSIAVDFLNGGLQPLATLGWPESEEEAVSMSRLPLDFVRCVDCGHIYNRSFDYNQVPYSKRPNLMFNAGKNWSKFLRETHGKIVECLPAMPSIVEIGYGDGGFLCALGELVVNGRLIGFDPHGSKIEVPSIETRDTLFEPQLHMAELQPDIIISRHVLEHLTNPLSFLQELSFAATARSISPLAYFEVPCIDNVLTTGRTVDFYYEHSSQFTTRSFTTMLSRAGVEVLEIGHGYGMEVVYALVKIGGDTQKAQIIDDSQGFLLNSDKAKATIRQQLSGFIDQGLRVCIWGGTGKSAAFIGRYEMDNKRFPMVVDSDDMKVGTYVPGTGQLIRSRDYLKDNPVDVLVIPPQWRAQDITGEMQSHGIKVDRVLIEHDGQLIDFHQDDHNYGLLKR